MDIKSVKLHRQSLHIHITEPGFKKPNQLSCSNNKNDRFSAKMILNQALALPSKHGYAHEVKKKSNYREVKTDHLCLYDNLAFKNMVFISILFAIWHTIYTPQMNRQTELWLFLSGKAWTCSFPILRILSCLDHCHFWEVNTPDFLLKARPFCSLEYRSQRQKEGREVEEWLHSLVVTQFTWKEKGIWSHSSQVLFLWVSLCLM